MEFLARLGLRTKIALPFIISAIALVFIGLYSVRTTTDLVESTDRLSSIYLPSVSEVLNADRDLYQALVAQMAYIDTAANNRDGRELLQDFDENAQQAFDRFKQASNRLQGTGVEDAIEGFDSAYKNWLASARKVLDLARSGDIRGARNLEQEETSALFSVLRDYFDKVGAHADEQANQRASYASAEGQSSSYTILIITIVSVLASVLLFMLFLKVIINSIQTLRSQLDNIAQGEGDLTQRVPVRTEDDLGELAKSFNLVLQNLQGMIGNIQSLTQELSQGASDLATAANDNHDGVARQTDAISMVATAINEMQSAIEEVAGNATRAAESTQEAENNGRTSAEIIRNSSQQVHRLATQIGKAVEVIRKLASDSENITSVLDVIRGIAEQTNLLALNAAIEAARAGEQGRGFAVVADEVRTLAQRTQQSTEDIQTMITTLQTGVAEIVSVMESGSSEAAETEKLATEAESQIQGILEAMTNISDVNTSVASATEEQTQVIDEINRSITEINDLAETSAERSRDIDGISRSLEGYASQLRDQTGRFRV
ncbi:MAG: methyl-accepting chemotaxis protein [Gammaproteobacteria bacterium]|uniref:Methyl-accepting chemotaxis protein n=1 Tax=Marinobacter nitratireducens TaxID=1137280 RepID=A0A072N1H1_9GAMM|nr:methyl-accepting chemotaxis protein [Marinobacter nitratireducens]KEF31514.1 Methyl-accepting chemotaxis protein [Marinobacter nitratireducens]TNE72707.1 MAG: methyl-accepting chemotaxis protein [Gammaproteobacteria bacterium]